MAYPLDEAPPEYTFDVLRLWEMPPEQVLNTTFYELWPLAGLMAEVTAETTLAVAELDRCGARSPQDRDESSRLLVLLAGLRVPRAARLEALRRRTMLGDLWKESSLAEALADRWREEAMGEMLQVVLQSRFGPLSEDIVAALRTADEAALRAIGEHITTGHP